MLVIASPMRASRAVRISVRGEDVAHLTPDEAINLANQLTHAVDQLDRRGP